MEEYPGGVDHFVGCRPLQTGNEVGSDAIHIGFTATGDLAAGQVERRPGAIDHQWPGHTGLPEPIGHLVDRREVTVRTVVRRHEGQVCQVDPCP